MMHSRLQTHVAKLFFVGKSRFQICQSLIQFTHFLDKLRDWLPTCLKIFCRRKQLSCNRFNLKSWEKVIIFCKWGGKGCFICFSARNKHCVHPKICVPGSLSSNLYYSDACIFWCRVFFYTLYLTSVHVVIHQAFAFGAEYYSTNPMGNTCLVLADNASSRSALALLYYRALNPWSAVLLVHVTEITNTGMAKDWYGTCQEMVEWVRRWETCSTILRLFTIITKPYSIQPRNLFSGQESSPQSTLIWNNWKKLYK